MFRKMDRNFKQLGSFLSQGQNHSVVLTSVAPNSKRSCRETEKCQGIVKEFQDRLLDSHSPIKCSVPDFWRFLMVIFEK